MFFAGFDEKIANLQAQIHTHETQLNSLKRQLATVEFEAAQSSIQQRPPTYPSTSSASHTAYENHDPHDMSFGFPEDWQAETLAALSASNPPALQRWPLGKEEYKRYGRQLIMPEVGLKGQLALKASKVLIVGAGGLGCPAAAYLAGAGVGTLGLVDGDTVEESNLHRQIMHGTGRVGMGKVNSAIVGLTSLNPNVKYVPHRAHLTAESSLDIVDQYDLVLDCTDNPASRYLISDTCVLLSKPLVSASALRTDGQLMVLNNPPRPPGDSSGGPCYRCVFPKPPPPESVTSCGEGGILGPVVGVMGVLQALEAIKIISSGSLKLGTSDKEMKNHTNGNSAKDSTAQPPSLLMFSAFSPQPFRTIRLRSRKLSCPACSAQATITSETLLSGSLDYVQFCGTTHPVQILNAKERISATEYAAVREEEVVLKEMSFAQPPGHVLVDVREKVQWELAALDGAINIPFSKIASTKVPIKADEMGSKTPNRVGVESEAFWLQELRSLPTDQTMFVVCRLGNDSQLAVRKFKELGLDHDGTRAIKDIQNGLLAWRRDVDTDFPDY
ncbi:hypothetical protein K402DRAFT_391800 [Aulographum hederae CBS 113979]|uniref:Adenylyltransferase and sulfurtransferase uba4 n=1 Tax=Aulographum hederae CBS 113979 TaxID=1176131 RepID=A0A6G1H680_9PEZI|nr:hypothetical protein K402DRAFT_391800 [Aulographum hederae CBS 113979]